MKTPPKRKISYHQEIEDLIQKGDVIVNTPVSKWKQNYNNYFYETSLYTLSSQARRIFNSSINTKAHWEFLKGCWYVKKLQKDLGLEKKPKNMIKLLKRLIN